MKYGFSVFLMASCSLLTFLSVQTEAQVLGLYTTESLKSVNGPAGVGDPGLTVNVNSFYNASIDSFNFQFFMTPVPETGCQATPPNANASTTIPILSIPQFVELYSPGGSWGGASNYEPTYSWGSYMTVDPTSLFYPFPYCTDTLGGSLGSHPFGFPIQNLNSNAGQRITCGTYCVYAYVDLTPNYIFWGNNTNWSYLGKIAYENCSGGTPSVTVLDSSNTSAPDAVAANSKKGNSPITLFPNPAHDVLTINLPQSSIHTTLGAKVEIIDTNGRIFQTQAVSVSTPSIQLDVSSFSSGEYWVRLSADGSSTASRFVKY